MRLSRLPVLTNGDMILDGKQKIPEAAKKVISDYRRFNLRFLQKKKRGLIPYPKLLCP
jgi:hypothetical protein